jgi:hypothetical protein
VTSVEDSLTVSAACLLNPYVILYPVLKDDLATLVKDSVTLDVDKKNASLEAVVKLVILLVVKGNDKKESLLVVLLNQKGDLVEAENVFRISTQKQEKKLVAAMQGEVKKDAHYYVGLVMQRRGESPVTLTQPAQRDSVESNRI